MILHTGGFASAATSTRSNPRLRAICIASCGVRTPICALVSPSMTRTLGARILSLMRVMSRNRDWLGLEDGVRISVYGFGLGNRNACRTTSESAHGAAQERMQGEC